jgi:hypothetical protein
MQALADCDSESGSIESASVQQSTPTKAQLTHLYRRHVAAQLYDESQKAGPGIAIYWLVDPRALREVRYVGQTRNPRRRFLQHLQTARLWLPEELPWWVSSSKLRPLYEWIRQLYGEERRLPTMIVCAWEAANGRAAERAEICACLARRQPLLNVESLLNSKQQQL